jgi:mono/diheme cytochrome c family protein
VNAWSRAARWVLGLTLSGCRTEDVFIELDPDLNRMLEQPRVDPYESAEALRLPPEGTEVYAPGGSDPRWLAGKDRAGFVRVAPRAPTRATLAAGRERFETICAACHGVIGDGVSVPARFMPRPPPSLHEARLRELAAGDLFQVISQGYGVMPGYATLLAAGERWAIVDYVQALQLSQNARLSELSPRLKSEFGAQVR